MRTTPANILVMAPVIVLRAYRYLVSPMLGNNCRFYPSCSSYAETAITEFGLFKGSWMALKRLSKCHPWHEGGLDPVPPAPVNSHPHAHGSQPSCHYHQQTD